MGLMNGGVNKGRVVNLTRTRYFNKEVFLLRKQI